MLTNTSSEAAYQVAERIRLKLSSFDKTSSGGQLPEPITISIALQMAVAVVDALEAVEIADDNRNRTAGFTGTECLV